MSSSDSDEDSDSGEVPVKRKDLDQLLKVVSNVTRDTKAFKNSVNDVGKRKDALSIRLHSLDPITAHASSTITYAVPTTYASTSDDVPLHDSEEDPYHVDPMTRAMMRGRGTGRTHVGMKRKRGLSDSKSPGNKRSRSDATQDPHAAASTDEAAGADADSILLQSPSGRSIAKKKDGSGLLLRYFIAEGSRYQFDKSHSEPLMKLALSNLGLTMASVHAFKSEWRVLGSLVILLLQKEFQGFEPPIFLMSEVVAITEAESTKLQVSEILDMQPMPISAALLSGYYLMGMQMLYSEDDAKRIVVKSLPMVADYVGKIKSRSNP